MIGLILAIWIGIDGLGITAEQSFDYGGPETACAVLITCGPGIEFVGFTTDPADLPAFDALSSTREYSITGYVDGQLAWSVDEGFSYYTGSGATMGLEAFTWRPIDEGHFLFLQTAAGEIFVGIEDLALAVSDLDYNDALYRLDLTTVVPEPTSLVLLGTGLALLARLRRRREAAR